MAAGVHGLPEEHEDIRVSVKTLVEVEALLDAGAIESGHTLIALYWLLRQRDNLRRQWVASPAATEEQGPDSNNPV
jgi:ADP-ribose pyrophosphatase